MPGRGRLRRWWGLRAAVNPRRAKLAARFWDVDSGRIMLGGQDISTIDPETLLRHYSVVFQDVVLFNASGYGQYPDR